MKVKESQVKKESNVEEKLSCPEKPSEDYSANFGSSMIFYKEKGSENLACYWCCKR